MRTRLPLIVATLGIVVASGCTTSSAGTPLPGPSTETSTSSNPGPDNDLPSDGAPKVEDPLDVSRFEQKPCEALTAENAQVLNLPATGEQRGDAIGETCYWLNDQTRGMLGISFFSGDKRGLSSLYREARDVDFPYFEAISDIEGYPAIAYDTKADKPTTACSVGVGVSDQLAVSVRIELSDANIGNKDPCIVAAQATGMMMKTMQEAA